MLFCDIELAARIERAESRLIAGACSKVAQRAGRAFATTIAGGVAAFAGVGSPLNKVVGLGFVERPTDEEIDGFERAYAERHAKVRVELSTLADPALARALTRRGYELVGFEDVLGRRLSDLGASEADLQSPRSVVEVARSTSGELDAWIDVVVSGFAAPDERSVPAHEEYERSVLERVIRDLVQADGVLRYVAHVDGRAAGGAALCVGDGLAQLFGASTLPALRRRGVQSALLAARLTDAIRHGCDLAVVTAQPGSASRQNVQRAGFQLLYSRAILTRGP